jgi:hypothetical protein
MASRARCARPHRRCQHSSLRDIVAVDELGDDLFEGAHIYAPFSPLNGAFLVFLALA